MKNLYKLMFFNTMIIGTLISISTLSWFTSWIGLEVNLLSLMPLMKQFNNKYASEATIKYFITQAMASSILLFSIIVSTNMKNYSIEMTTMSSLMVSTALLLKMGAAPLHFWFPEVMSGLSWEMAYIMMTWQKIAPMILLTYTTYVPMFLSLIIIISSMVSGIQGMNYVCLRKIMAYSSINHVSWMISALLNSTTIWLNYFIIYCMINFNIIIVFYKYNIFYMNQMNKLFTFNKKLKIFFMLNFLNLGGLPPFLGFYPKWLTINHMILSNFYMLAILLIIFTLMSLYIYLRITFSGFTMNTEETLTKIYKMTSYSLFVLNFFSLMGLTICLIMTNIF